MKTTALRTTIAAAVVALGVAAPAAHATKNTGKFQQTQMAKAGAHASFCDDMFTIFEGDVDLADAADKRGDRAGLNAHLADATKTLNDARASGCDWAA